MKKLLLTLLLFSAGTGISAAKTYDLKSPDGKIAVRVDVGADAVTYSISRDGKELIAPSPLSLTLADGRVLVTVTPLLPVARVFDGSDSYYVNREGKRIRANARYFSDVPVIMGHFPREDSVFTPLSLMPLFDWLNEHAETWGRFITMVKVESPNDVILIPAITGHVINIGAPEGFDSKFERLRKVYQKVIPLKGWKYYDTLSVKWAGQLVATRRSKPVEQVAAASDDEDETTDVSTMLAGEGVAPGQTKPGEKAHNDKPIPGAAAAEKPKKEDKPDRKPAEKESKKDNKKSKNTQH